MTTSAKSNSKPARKSPARSMDALTLLMDDHKKVKKLFKEYEKLSKKDDVDAKVEMALQICEELTVHAKIEEEIFYPAVRVAIHADDLLNEAEVEHATAKELIAQIEEMSGDDPLYDAKLKVLSEYIDHHVGEEENEMFPKVKKAKIDLEELGSALTERKEELTMALA